MQLKSALSKVVCLCLAPALPPPKERFSISGNQQLPGEPVWPITFSFIAA
jgi:hypothetical protein